jgi:hypothetical protein
LWPWSYGNWIYNYLCNQCLSPLTLWVRILLMVRYTRYNITWPLILWLMIWPERKFSSCCWLLIITILSFFIIIKTYWYCVWSYLCLGQAHRQGCILQKHKKTYCTERIFINKRKQQCNDILLAVKRAVVVVIVN